MSTRIFIIISIGDFWPAGIAGLAVWSSSIDGQCQRWWRRPRRFRLHVSQEDDGRPSTAWSAHDGQVGPDGSQSASIPTAASSTGSIPATGPSKPSRIASASSSPAVHLGSSADLSTSTELRRTSNGLPIIARQWRLVLFSLKETTK